MKKNMGKTDKMVRIIIAAVLVGLFITGVISGWLGVVLMVVALIFVLTSLINFCPIYRLFGVRTCKV